MNPNSYAAIVSEYFKHFQQFNEQQFLNKTPNELYDPIRYIMSIGGKRFRPILVLMTHHLFDSNWSKSLPAAYAVELFHNFTLLHDDIMDNSLTRRGHATVHAKFNTNSAILSGDNMLIFCYKYIMDQISDPNQFLLVSRSLTENGILVCEGQAMDVEFENRTDVTETEYLKMIQYKTAVLIGASLQIGAILGGASNVNVQSMYNFGLNIGIAFQVLDDVLDTYGDENFGKKIGGDILQGKKTLLYIKCRDLANEEDRQTLLEIYEDSEIKDTEKLKDVHSLFEKYKVKEACYEYIEKYNSEAHLSLDNIEVDSSQLVRLTSMMMNRNI